MRKFALFLLLLAPLTSIGQSLMPVPPQQCVWHAGDDPDGKLGWADPTLDEAGWKPFANRTFDQNQPRIWVRCHVDPAPLLQSSHPAVQVAVRTAYQIFFDGRPAGAFGDMETGDFTADYVRTYPLAMPLPATEPSSPRSSTIALRILMRLPLQGSFIETRASGARDTAVTLGERHGLEDHRDSLALERGLRNLPVTIVSAIVGVAGFMLFGLYCTDRSRLAFLFLAVHCWAFAFRRVLEGLAFWLYPISIRRYGLLDNLVLVFFPSLVLVGYALARKSVPWSYRIVLGLHTVLALGLVGRAFLSAPLSLRYSETHDVINILVNLLWVPMYLTPFVAFWPWRRISGSLRYSAAALMVWGFVNEVYIVLLLGLNFHVRFAAPLLESVIETRAVLTLAAVVVLLAILFRDQRKTAEERALLAGELDAAREIQQRLVPASLPEIPGLHMEAAYLPAAEVGGDFYQVIPQSFGLDSSPTAGSTLIVVGDVSGKGLKAAMTGTLAIGALRTLAAEDLSPADILTRLNRQMNTAGHGGFITCICALLHPDGTVLIANAGHLSPYRNGIELACDNGLPLGLAAEAEYAQTTVHLAAGDRLTLLTDGVIEARDAATGELFGFARTATISTHSADQIAAAAQTFGQDDDITVLTLTLQSQT